MICGAVQLALYKPLDFVYTRLLIVVNPANAIESRYLPNVAGQLRFDRWKLEILICKKQQIECALKNILFTKNWNDVSIMIECTSQLKRRLYRRKARCAKVSPATETIKNRYFDVA